MSKIKVNCPKCNKEITISIKTIDYLRIRIEELTKERDLYKTALENINSKSKWKKYYD